MVGPRQDQGYRRLDRGYRQAECGCFRRGGAGHRAQFERPDRDRRGARRRCGPVRPFTGARGAARDRYFRRRNDRFRRASGRGARPYHGGRDFDQRARDSDRGALARRLLSPQCNRRAGCLCPCRARFSQLRRGDAAKAGAGSRGRPDVVSAVIAAQKVEQRPSPWPSPRRRGEGKRLRCNRCGSGRSR